MSNETFSTVEDGTDNYLLRLGNAYVSIFGSMNKKNLEDLVSKYRASREIDQKYKALRQFTLKKNPADLVIQAKPLSQYVNNRIILNEFDLLVGFYLPVNSNGPAGFLVGHIKPLDYRVVLTEGSFRWAVYNKCPAPFALMKEFEYNMLDLWGFYEEIYIIYAYLTFDIRSVLVSANQVTKIDDLEILFTKKKVLLTKKKEENNKNKIDLLNDKKIIKHYQNSYCLKFVNS